MIKGLVAIVGRPNVGKSTLFNKLTKSDRAIVDNQPGVTRDRLYGVARTHDAKGDEHGFWVIDTGGFETDDYNFQPFEKNIVWEQTQQAIQEAELVVFMLDGKTGLHPHDMVILRDLEKQGKPWIAVVNKIDGVEKGAETWEFYELGITEFHTMSAAHNRGVGSLKDAILEQLNQLVVANRHDVNDDDYIKVALVGRPNAGKSSILNRLAGEDRSLVSEVAGTTRDSIDTLMAYKERPLLIVDTAGIRRKTKIKQRLESLSVIQSIKAIERADIVYLVLDATAGLTDQDARLASLTMSRHKPLCIVVNKWDLIPNKDSNAPKAYAEALRTALGVNGFVPVKFVSALTNQRVHKLLEMAVDLYDRAGVRVPTAKLNNLLRRVVDEHTPALIRNHTKRVKFFYATQVKSRPPTFVIFCNVADEIQEAYKRYITNRFRDELGFGDVPLRLFFRAKTDVRASWEEREQGVELR